MKMWGGSSYQTRRKESQLDQLSRRAAIRCNLNARWRVAITRRESPFYASLRARKLFRIRNIWYAPADDGKRAFLISWWNIKHRVLNVKYFSTGAFRRNARAATENSPAKRATWKPGHKWLTFHGCFRKQWKKFVSAILVNLSCSIFNIYPENTSLATGNRKYCRAFNEYTYFGKKRCSWNSHNQSFLHFLSFSFSSILPPTFVFLFPWLASEFLS